MQVTVEKVSTLERCLAISVPADRVGEAYTKQLNAYAKNASIKGFRPGKVPASQIEQRYGAEVRQRTVSKLIEDSLLEALMEKGLRPVSTPRVDIKSKLEILGNEPLEFTATFEILPEIENVLFNLEKIEKPVVEINEAEVDRVIGQLQKQYAEWKLIDREARETDRMVIDYDTVFEGKTDENSSKGFSLELGSKVMIPGFEENLIGSKTGDERRLNLTYPQDFQVTERAGKPVEFVVQIKQVFEANMPAIDETFVKKLGIKSGSVEDLKNQIKQSLVQEKDRLILEKLKDQVFRNLLEQNPIEVPQAMITNEAHKIHDEIYQHQKHDHHSHSDEEMTAFNEIAKKRVMLGVLIAEYARKTNLVVDAGRVNKRIHEIAAAYENPEEVSAWLSSEKNKSGIEVQVMEEQVVEKLITDVPNIEKPMTYAELRGN